MKNFIIAISLMVASNAHASFSQECSFLVQNNGINRIEKLNNNLKNEINSMLKIKIVKNLDDSGVDYKACNKMIGQTHFIVIEENLVSTINNQKFLTMDYSQEESEVTNSSKWELSRDNLKSEPQIDRPRICTMVVGELYNPKTGKCIGFYDGCQKAELMALGYESAFDSKGKRKCHDLKKP